MAKTTMAKRILEDILQNADFINGMMISLECKSMLLFVGENPAWIAKQMGHTNMNMILQKYGRYLPEHDPLASQKIISRML